MDIKPMRDCIFVKPDSAETKSAGGLVIPDFSQKRPTTGTILAVGPLVKELKEGQRVVFGEFSGAREVMQWDKDEVELMIMTEEDILAVEETHSNNTSI